MRRLTKKLFKECTLDAPPRAGGDVFFDDNRGQFYYIFGHYSCGTDMVHLGLWAKDDSARYVAYAENP